jgi:hypothetical protein
VVGCSTWRGAACGITTLGLYPNKQVASGSLPRRLGYHDFFNSGA